ncbi:MAG TPA: ABC transporter ATP-binding protein [Flavobacteriaceae bacterium]|nr:ABC transporter ATP-binding protein [Flavobacteriaceae bacterium]HIN98393.1 ABC transporter ATP-binding protein [Flavobacteriaceae bacterium]
MGIILKAENISKQYRLGLVGTGTIKHDLNRFIARIRGKEDPYIKIGAQNDRSVGATEDYVWALKDINFEVQEGEVLGIIGKNGAGKSTLLKILSRVTAPTTGVIKTKGRIASLLEVGTGFHPELTGKENIYLNGAILGMSKSEIKEKEEEIIEFSGCQMYIDTPVKRYSSGMRVRLAFAVAAHLEPDILVVDEVLAVGDAEFQKKAIGKMQDISKADGRTVLFVSHNMATIQDLCTRVIVLKNGLVYYDGSVSKGVETYLNESKLSAGHLQFEKDSNLRAQIQKIELLNTEDKITNNYKSGETLIFKLNFRVSSVIRNPIVSVRLSDHNSVNVVSWRSNDLINEPIPKNLDKDFTLKLISSDLYLLNGVYTLSIGFADGKEILNMKIDIIHFEIFASKPNDNFRILTKENASKSLVFAPATWQIYDE